MPNTMSRVYIEKTVALMTLLIADPNIPEIVKSRLRGHLIMGRVLANTKSWPTTDKVIQLYTDAKE